MFLHTKIVPILSLLALAAPAWADETQEPAPPPAEPPLTLLGFAHGGKTVLFRRGTEGGDGSLIFLRRNGRQASLPDDGIRLAKLHKYGHALKGTEQRLAARGRSLSLAAAGKGVLLGVGKFRARIPMTVPAECKVQALAGGLLSRRLQALAAVVRLACTEAPEVRRLPLAVALRSVMNQQFHRYDRLATRGKLDLAEQALDMAAAIAPGATRVYYRRAHMAALRADTAGAVRWLRKLRNRGTAAARQMVVKARWDKGFRLVKDAAAFKTVTTL